MQRSPGCSSRAKNATLMFAPSSVQPSKNMNLQMKKSYNKPNNSSNTLKVSQKKKTKQTSSKKNWKKKRKVKNSKNSMLKKSMKKKNSKDSNPKYKSHQQLKAKCQFTTNTLDAKQKSILKKMKNILMSEISCQQILHLNLYTISLHNMNPYRVLYLKLYQLKEYSQEVDYEILTELLQ